MIYSTRNTHLQKQQLFTKNGHVFISVVLITVGLKVHKHEIFFILFLQKPKPYGPKGL